MTSSNPYARVFGIRLDEQPKPEPMVPEHMLDAALTAYQRLEAEIAPLYRRLRRTERSRDQWRYAACFALVALAGALLLLVVVQR